MKTVLAPALAIACLLSNAFAQEEKANLTLDELEHAIEAAAKAKDVENLPGLIDQAAAIDLRSALAYAARHEIDGAVIGGGWRPGTDGLPDAFATAVTSPYSSYRHHLILGVINDWVKHDHATALATITALPASPLTTELREHHNLAMVRFRPADALTSAFENLGKPVAIKVRDAAYALAKSDMKTALARIGDLPRKDKAAAEQVVVAVAKIYSGADPAAAAKWSTTLGHPNELQLAVEEVAYNWSEKAPDDTGDWATALDAGPARDAALRPLVFNTAPKNPAKAFSWSLLAGDAGLRDTLAATAVLEWSLTDSDAARKAVEAAELPAEAKKPLNEILDSAVQ